MSAGRAVYGGLGGLVALWLFAGRSRLERLGVEGEAGLLADPRIWLLVAIVIGSGLGLLLIKRRPSGVLQGARLVHASYLVLAAWSLTGIAAGESAAAKLLDIAVIVGVVALSTAVRRSDPHGSFLRGFTSSVVILSVVFILLGGFKFAGGDASGRLAVLGGGPNVYARLVGFAGLWAAALARGHWILRTGLVGASGMFVILSGSRGGMFAFGLALAFVLVSLPWRRSAVIILAVFAAGGAFSTLTQVGRTAAERFQRRTVELTLGEQYSSGRDVIYPVALDLIRRRPWLGNGLDAFRDAGLTVFHPHNLVIEAGVDGGIGMMAIVGLFLAVLVWRSWQARAHPEGPVVPAWVVFIAAASMVSGDLYDARLLFLAPVLLLVRQPRAAPSPAPTLADAGAPSPEAARPPLH